MCRRIIRTNCKGCFSSCMIVIELKGAAIVGAWKDDGEDARNEVICDNGMEAMEIFVEKVVSNNFKLTYGEITHIRGEGDLEGAV